MLRFPCLVLDHDDTVVSSEERVNYPCFLQLMEYFRPEWEKMELDEFTRWCFDPGFAGLLREKYHFSPEEMAQEFQMWLDYSAHHIPPAYPGMGEIILEQKRRGGMVCVVSHSARENIQRDYQTHFGLQPDLIFSWEDPPEQRKPSVYPLETIMATYGLRPEELLMVDDLKPGRDMAKAAGVPIAYAGWSRSRVPELGIQMRQWCDYAFDDPKDLADFLFPIAIP